MKRAAKRTPTQSSPTPTPAPAPSVQPDAANPASPPTLRDCLAPLASAALQTSINAHKWGVSHKGSLLRASRAMELCAAIVEECNALVRAEEGASEGIE